MTTIRDAFWSQCFDILDRVNMRDVVAILKFSIENFIKRGCWPFFCFCSFFYDYYEIIDGYASKNGDF